jgi:hypothetical protein
LGDVGSVAEIEILLEAQEANLPPGGKKRYFRQSVALLREVGFEADRIFGPVSVISVCVTNIAWAPERRDVLVFDSVLLTQLGQRLLREALLTAHWKVSYVDDHLHVAPLQKDKEGLRV